MRLALALMLAPPLLPAVAGATPPAASVAPDTSNDGAGWRYRCTAEQLLAGGTVSLTRLYTVAGAMDGGDYMRWTPTGHDPQRPVRPLAIALSYLWPTAEQPAIAPRRIALQLRVAVEADLPPVALIRMQRPMPVEPYGVLSSTALATQIFPYTYAPRDGHGDVPLGDLLAYADGFDSLGWTLIDPSNQLGGDRELARGTIDVAALRAAVNALPALRATLAGKAAAPLRRCDRTPWIAPPVVP